MKILVTGSAGFIGFHVAKKLLKMGHDVHGIDILNDYYDVSLKKARLENLLSRDNFSFAKIDITDLSSYEKFFDRLGPDKVIHLAAQAGVRYSIENPHAYIDSNIVGFLNVLEGCRREGTKHLVYASSSSVYGGNQKLPFSIFDSVDKPLSLYGVTKRSNELMALSYGHLFGMRTTALRFFTVYGPWGRPDMSLFLFTKKILSGEPIDVFNNGDHCRDFTYIDDVVSAVVKAVNYQSMKTQSINENSIDNPGDMKVSSVFNVGNNRPEKLMHVINLLEKEIGKVAIKNFLPLQPGDVQETFADIELSTAELGYLPSTTIEEGIRKFVSWYRDFYGV